MGATSRFLAWAGCLASLASCSLSYGDDFLAAGDVSVTAATPAIVSEAESFVTFVVEGRAIASTATLEVILNDSDGATDPVEYLTNTVVECAFALRSRFTCRFLAMSAKAKKPR